MLKIDNLRVEYRLRRGTHLAVRDISLDIRPGEFFTLLGPSGCGKTTTLRSVAGLETPTGGAIRIDDEAVFDAGRQVYVPTHKRPISMVFQSYAIWPHMTVGDNVGFPLEAMGVKRGQIRAKVAETLQMVGLGDYIDRPATQLSGGQQQRVALARAIVKGAKVLLLDEPLSNLDAKLREQMRHELRQLQRTVGTTTIYVTHDQEEALSLSDRIAVMNLGDVVELGTPQELYLRPRHAFTARFIGQAELLPCEPDAQRGQGLQVRTPMGAFVAGGGAAELLERPERATHLMIRPEHVKFVNGEALETNALNGRIENVLFSGKLVEYAVRVGETRMTVYEASTHLKKVGDEVRLYLPPEHCVLLEDSPAGGRA
jgi:iron(III) transport system ATP-binding protein